MPINQNTLRRTLLRMAGDLRHVLNSLPVFILLQEIHLLSNDRIQLESARIRFLDPAVFLSRPILLIDLLAQVEIPGAAIDRNTNKDGMPAGLIAAVVFVEYRFVRVSHRIRSMARKC